MSDSDEQWFDALAGAGDPPPAQARELAAIRRAAARLDEAPVDELARQRLFARLQREGLLDAPAPVARRPNWLRGLARAAVILLCFGIVLEWTLFAPVPPEQALTAPPPALPEKARDKTAAVQADGAPEAAAGSTPRARPAQEQSARALEDVAPLVAAQESQTLVVVEPSEALTELEELAAQTDGIALATRESGGEDRVSVTLECADEPACARLNEVLAGLAENADDVSKVSPGQSWRWILERRGP